jgi:hypothetical protein
VREHENNLRIIADDKNVKPTTTVILSDSDVDVDLDLAVDDEEVDEDFFSSRKYRIKTDLRCMRRTVG